jgi:hypothetical protein
MLGAGQSKLWSAREPIHFETCPALAFSIGFLSSHFLRFQFPSPKCSGARAPTPRGVWSLRPVRATQAGRDTWLAMSLPKPQTLVARVSFLGESP